MPELATIATLGLAVDNSQVDRAKASLDAFNASAAGAEARTMALAGQVSGLESAYASAVGGAVVPITHELEKIPGAALKGEYGLGRIERAITSLGISASGLSGEGGHIAHLAAMLASLGEGGPLTLGLIGGATAIEFMLKELGDQAEVTAKQIEHAHKAAIELGNTRAGAAQRSKGDINTELGQLEQSNLYHSGVLQQAFDVGNAEVYAAQLEIIGKNLDKIHQDEIELARLQDDIVKAHEVDIHKWDELRAAGEAAISAISRMQGLADKALEQYHLTQLGINEEQLKQLQGLDEILAKGHATAADWDVARRFQAQLTDALQTQNLTLEERGKIIKELTSLSTAMNEATFQPETLALMHDEIDRIGESIRVQLAGWDKMSVAEKKLLHDLQGDFSKFFDELLTNGLSSFQSLFDSVRQMFIKLVADMAAQKLIEQLQGSGALAGEGAIRGSTGAGAINPVTVAIAGGLLVLGGIVDWMHRAAQEAVAVAKATKDFAIALEGYQSALKPGSLGEAVQQERDRAQAIRDQALATEHLTHDTEAYYAAIDRINTIEQERIRALDEEATNDLRVRSLRAQGLAQEADDVAFVVQQQKDYSDAAGAVTEAQNAYNDAVKAHADAATLARLAEQESTAETYLASLAEVQKQEALKRSMDLQKQALQAQIDADQKKLDSATALLDATSRTVGTLQSYYHELQRLTASPIQDIGLAKQSLQDLAAKALAGDQNAAGQLPDAAKQFLLLSQQYNASGAGYTADVQYVQNLLGPIIDFYQKQQTDQQKMVDLLQQSLALHQGQLDALKAGFLQEHNDLNLIYHRSDLPTVGGGGGLQIALTPEQATGLVDNTAKTVAVLTAGLGDLTQQVVALRADVQATTYQVRQLSGGKLVVA